MNRLLLDSSSAVKWHEDASNNIAKDSPNEDTAHIYILARAICLIITLCLLIALFAVFIFPHLVLLVKQVDIRLKESPIATIIAGIIITSVLSFLFLARHKTQIFVKKFIGI